MNILLKNVLCGAIILSAVGCEKHLQNVTYGTTAGDNFFKTANDAKAAVSAMYTGMTEGGTYYAGWNSAEGSFRAQAAQTTDENICNWDDGGLWVSFNMLNFTPDLADITSHYTELMPYISQCTVDIANIEPINMDENLKAQYIAELKALRAYYMQILYLYYGPVPARLDATQIDNEDAPPLPRPSKDSMVNYIVRDFTDAIAVLPNTFTGADYGRFSKAACYTSLMKLYMHEKDWDNAINCGEKIKEMGFSLIPNYEDNFNINNKGGNSELIFVVVCSSTAATAAAANAWLAHVLPTNYYDSTGIPLTEWDGYRMPWKTYDKFDQNDKRLKVLLAKYPTGVDANGNLIYYDCRANGDIGAVPMKFGPDPSKANSEASSVDLPVFRYADVELMLAEALNEQNSGPTSEAYSLINDVRQRAGLPLYTAGDSHDSFLTKIQNERLFELWDEGVRRDDLIRWGMYIQRAINDGSTFADSSKILYPIPRSVINQSNGVIQQNPGYN